MKKVLIWLLKHIASDVVVTPKPKRGRPKKSRRGRPVGRKDMKPRIIIVSGSRADFGILKNMYLNLKKEKKCSVNLFFGSQHFNKKFSYTYFEAKKDQINIDYKLSYNLKKNK